MLGHNMFFSSTVKAQMIDAAAREAIALNSLKSP